MRKQSDGNYEVVGIHIIGNDQFNKGIKVDERVRKRVNNWITRSKGTLTINKCTISNKVGMLHLKILEEIGSTRWSNVTDINIRIF